MIALHVCDVLTIGARRHGTWKAYGPSRRPKCPSHETPWCQGWQVQLAGETQQPMLQRLACTGHTAIHVLGQCMGCTGVDRVHAFLRRAHRHVGHLPSPCSFQCLLNPCCSGGSWSIAPRTSGVKQWSNGAPGAAVQPVEVESPIVT